jgi:hypothetical protein
MPVYNAAAGVTIGLASTVIVGANAGRTAIYLYNDSPIELIYLSLDGSTVIGTPGTPGGSAHVGRGIRLNPNGDSWWSVSTAEGQCYQGAISGIVSGETAGLAVITFAEF